MDQKHLPSHEPAGSDQVFVFPHHKAPVLPPDERHNNENWPSQRKHRGCYYKTMDAKDSRCTFLSRLYVNVALQVSKKKTAKTDGFKPWTRDDFEKFRDHWPIGTKQRLAFELMYRTCAAIGDTCRLTRSMIDDGWLTYERQKSHSTATCPFTVDGPDWFEATDDLAACLAVEPMHMSLLTTENGKSRSEKAASSWFSKAAKAAGLEDGKTAHGIRKCRSAMFKENGASADQRMAVLGHESESETLHYSKSADLRKTIEGTKKFQLSEQVPTEINNLLKMKEKNSV